METLEAIAKRTSTRKFKETQISEENLQAILKAGMAAPVGSGAYNSLHITVVQNQSVFSKINAAGIGICEYCMCFGKYGNRCNKSGN